jgi:hypothetical protein
LDFTAIGRKRQGREVSQWLRVKPGAKHPVWKTQSTGDGEMFLVFDSETKIVYAHASCLIKISPR